MHLLMLFSILVKNNFDVLVLKYFHVHVLCYISEGNIVRFFSTSFIISYIEN